MTIIDISVPLHRNIPIWPGSAGFKFSWTKRKGEGDECNNSFIEMDSHVGTHMDAPFHFCENGATVNEISLGTLIGPCSVIYLPELRKISPKDLADADINPTTQRLLIKTDNSELWADGSLGFTKNYVALTPDAAEWIVSRKIKLVGIDYLSIGGYTDGTETHRILFDAGVVAVEGLNLLNVHPGNYELICLPIKIQNAEGAPVRAVLRSVSGFNIK